MHNFFLEYGHTSQRSENRSLRNHVSFMMPQTSIGNSSAGCGRGHSVKIKSLGRMKIKENQIKLKKFGGLVLGCIDADFYNQTLILQHFSRSTRFKKPLHRSECKNAGKSRQTFSHFCSVIFKFGAIFCKLCPTITILNEKFPEFQQFFVEKIKIS